jgi:hypothetical protein
MKIIGILFLRKIEKNINPLYGTETARAGRLRYKK